MTRLEKVAFRAAELLAEALASANGTDMAPMLLNVARAQAEQEIDGKPARNAVVMLNGVKVIVDGHALEES
jgi:hypothetical protein